jgi:hypothetical protein
MTDAGMLPDMRIFLVFAAFALAACATSTPVATETQAPAAVAASPSAHLAEMLASAGRADAPSRAMVERAFGVADIVRQDGAGAALTYRLESCALLLLFSADANNEMRLAEAHPSARRAGASAPDLAQCAAEAASRGA